MIRIRTFRATDEPESCEKFIEGHLKILKVFGITMITSAKTDWFDDPFTQVIIAESPDGEKVYGGARLQIAGGENMLPIEKAVTELDINIHSTVKQFAKSGAAEVCGLWNSKEVAGMGIGSVFLSRTAIAIAPSLNIKTLFALCAPYTVDKAFKTGFEVATFLGTNGTFYYPKDDLVATAMMLFDTDNLPTADPQEKKEILSLRTGKPQIKTETGIKGKFDIEYDLSVSK